MASLSSSSDSSDSEAGEEDPTCGQYGSPEGADNEGSVTVHGLRPQVQLQTQPDGTQSQDPDTAVDVCTTAIGRSHSQAVISALPLPAAEAFGMNIGATNPHSDGTEIPVMLTVVGQQESAVDAMLPAVPQLPARRPTGQLATAIHEHICHIMHGMAQLQLIDNKGRGSSVAGHNDDVAEELNKNGDVDLRQARHIRQNERIRKMCVACWEREKEVTLVPCEHECLCYRCFIDPDFSLRDPRQCPVCRRAFDGCRLTPHLQTEVLSRSQMP